MLVRSVCLAEMQISKRDAGTARALPGVRLQERPHRRCHARAASQ